MYINKINSNIYNLPIKNNQRAVPNNVVSIIGFTSQKNPAPANSYGEALVYMAQMDKLREETKEFPQDVEYRKNLLINAGMLPENQHRIRSIIGVQELKNIMSEFNDDEINYTSGDNFENVANHNLRANLHIHTIASDGSLPVLDVLDKAAEYADSVVRNKPETKKAPFVIAITDHDTLESSREAIKIISENPLKYKNLRVVLGVEMTTYNNVSTITGSPTNTHVLVYGIDPNEKSFSNFLDETKAKKQNLQEMMVSTANEIYKKHYGKEDFFSVSQAKLQYNQLDKNITGIYKNVDIYFQNKIAVEQIVLKNNKIVRALKKHNIPVDTDGFMEKMAEFRYGIDRNNKRPKPIQALPEFLSVCAGMNKDNVSQIIEAGLNDKKISRLNQDIQENIMQYKVTYQPKYDYMPTFKTVYEALENQKHTIMGIAHPLEPTKNIRDAKDKYAFLTEFYAKFNDECKEKATFSEAYYQSYSGADKEFKENETTKEFMDNISREYNLFKTGSQDTHGKNIFIR